jgi:hypothetical protein
MGFRLIRLTAIIFSTRERRFERVWRNVRDHATVTALAWGDSGRRGASRDSCVRRRIWREVERSALRPRDLERRHAGLCQRGPASLRKWLETEGVKNINNVNERLKAASPWYEKYGVKEAALVGA